MVLSSVIFSFPAISIFFFFFFFVKKKFWRAFSNPFIPLPRVNLFPHNLSRDHWVFTQQSFFLFFSSSFFLFFSFFLHPFFSFSFFFSIPSFYSFPKRKKKGFFISSTLLLRNPVFNQLWTRLPHLRQRLLQKTRPRRGKLVKARMPVPVAAVARAAAARRARRRKWQLKGRIGNFLLFSCCQMSSSWRY